VRELVAVAGCDRVLLAVAVWFKALTTLVSLAMTKAVSATEIKIAVFGCMGSSNGFV
jgi:BarA-like signal transduction histidine kinase